MGTYGSNHAIPPLMYYPDSPPPPYMVVNTVVNARKQRTIPQLHQRIPRPDLKCDQAREKKAGKPSPKKGQLHDQLPHTLLNPYHHTTPRMPPMSTLSASHSQVCIRPTPVHQVAPPLPKRPVTNSYPNPLSEGCLSKRVDVFENICRGIDDAASEACLDIGSSLPANHHVHFEKGIRPQHRPHALVQLNEILPDASARENTSSKVYQYANSRLPSDLPPFRASMDTYRLLSIAARYSLSAYSPPPHGASTQESHIPASFLTGTKAMVLRSIPVDNQNTLVLSIRGSASFADWAVNFRPAPSRPVDFLDDADNHCHSGFLSAARSMVRPVAARLRQLLEQDPSRCAASLLITGHSAGGAVAALLFAHMLSRDVESELTLLTGVFSRVHCVTFGAPPVSLLPLSMPPAVAAVPRFRKWCFVALVNQGDPVVRAGKDYVASLAKLWLAPVPSSSPRKDDRDEIHKKTTKPAGNKCVKGLVRAMKSVADLRGAAAPPPVGPSVRPVWKLPPAPLSCAGRLVVMREKSRQADGGVVEACEASDEMLRDVVFGDPAMHSMRLYAARVEALAFRAVTGRES